jgi:hypothetical protein
MVSVMVAEISMRRRGFRRATQAEGKTGEGSEKLVF